MGVFLLRANRLQAAIRDDVKSITRQNGEEVDKRETTS